MNGKARMTMPWFDRGAVFHICSGLHGEKKGCVLDTENLSRDHSVAVVIDSSNAIKNVVVTRFMRQGFKVAAVNLADYYSMKDMYDIRDYKKVSFIASEGENAGASKTLDRALDNLHKLHFYNYEISKIQSMKEIREKTGVRYLVLLDLKNWEDVSWGTGYRFKLT